jgi:signal transduction histidine kinase
MPPITVEADMERLQPVLWNLLSNSIKFTPNGGRVEVDLSVVSDAIAQGSKLSEFAQITLRDTGKGIRADFLPYVFERFRQADSSISREQGGWAWDSRSCVH